MNEQQKHLKDLLDQQKGLYNIINETNAKLNETRDNLLRIDGVIQYLTQIVGVKLPEQEVEEKITSTESNLKED